MKQKLGSQNSEQASGGTSMPAKPCSAPKEFFARRGDHRIYVDPEYTQEYLG